MVAKPRLKASEYDVMLNIINGCRVINNTKDRNICEPIIALISNDCQPVQGERIMPPGQNVPRTKCPMDKMAQEKLQDKKGTYAPLT